MASSGGVPPTLDDAAIAYDGFACLVGVRSKTFEGKKLALFDYAYYLRTGGTVVITPELRARVKRLVTRPPAA